MDVLARTGAVQPPAFRLVGTLNVVGAREDALVRVMQWL